VLDITGRSDLSILLQTIVERAARLTDAPAGGMYLCDPEKQEARCVVSYNTLHDYTGTVLKYGEGAAGIVAQTGEPLIIDDYRTWQGRATVFEEKRPFTSVLTVPMIWQGRVTGVIHVLHDTASRRFTQADQELLTLFANHAAIAVENTRLLEQEKYHAEELTRYSTNLEQLVSERTRRLGESERRFRELADLLPQIVFEIDVKGDFTFVNRVAFAITGYTEEELREGLNALQICVPEDRNRIMENMQRILAGEALPAREYMALRKDGSTFPVLLYSSPIIASGKPVGLRGIVIDITERKQAEEELRSARERLEYVISSNPAMIYAGKPRKDYSDYDAIYLSESVVKVLGFEPQDFIGHPEFWESRVHPDDVRQYSTEVPILWKEGQHTFEYRFLHKDGTYRWIREEAKVIRDAAGNPVEVMGYWTDVTEQKQTQEALVKSQRLATIGETAAMIGHDLRNPLEAIAGATYLLRRQAAAGTIDDDGRESLQIIEKSIEHSDRIINDLLEYSAEIKLQTSTTDPKSVTETALPLARIPENVKIVNETQAEPRMLMDADKIRRAFLNIIRNAVEAMPQGGTLTISSRRTDSMVEFKFADTGAGMSRETLENLWTPLFTTKARGMGFGLPITRRIVEAHGGTVAADSAPGKGSTFTVKLPVKTEAREVSGS
jgi:PAS domain S-box-containing protein